MNSSVRSSRTLKVGDFGAAPSSVHSLYPSMIVSPTTCTLTPERFRTAFRRSPKPTPSDSMRLSSLSTAIFGACSSIRFEEEYTMSPGVKTISPPYVSSASISSWVRGGMPSATYS